MGALCAQEKQPLLFHIGIPERSPANLIKTTSYNPITFLPLATIVQFKRSANVYFLVTAVLQFIPAISPLSPISAIAPLIFVLTISLIRAAIQEISKYKYDREANSNKFLVYTLAKAQVKNQQNSGDSDTEQEQIPMWSLKRSDELHIGDIIKIQSDQRCPADIILLSTSNIDGKVYIETSSLDGQKNLKIRNPLPSTQQMYCTLEAIQQMGTSKPLVTIQQPNQQLYSFNALLEYNKKLEKPLYGQRNKKVQKVSEFFKINQFLYRESVLRNTKEAVGVIAYVGKFTKSMMNSTGGKDKMSKLQRKVNFYMVFIFTLQFSLIVLCGLFQIFLYYRTVVGQAFTTIVLKQEQKSSIVQGIITSASYFILLNTMIPISLLVSIQIVKFGQGAFIGYDKLMTRKDPKLGVISSKAFRSSINEELGMVEYIFTDKTGTLTKNQMVLKQIIAGSKTFSNETILKHNQKQYYFNQQLKQSAFKDVRQVQKIFKNLAESVDGDEAQQYGELSRSPASYHKQSGSLMLLAMSTCHECLLVPSKSPSDPDEYHGSSPDQITLVDSAARLGYKFVDNCYANIRVKIGQVDHLQLKLEDTFQFNSDRKRMSIILSIPQLSGYKILFCKGADSIIDKLLRPQYKSQKNSEQFRSYEMIKQKITSYSRVGLRTLLFGYKLIPNSVYESVKRKIMEAGEPKLKQAASSGPDSKQSHIKSLEEGLFLCGATAVQDKLQDEVQTVIEDIIKANIKICMLTGDKLQTAENIGKSCRLLNQSWSIVRISQGSGEVDVFRGYCEVKDYIEASQKYGVLIQGTAISVALNSIYFAQILQNCSAAICCRITPKNKAQVVNFAKKHLNKLVLAIGDGANDVPMIQAAHIGIGLYGNEGMNAVQASDFAIPSFRCLWRLLFVHGRWNYLRIAELIKYFFYKNMVFTLCQLWFAYFCAFSGTSIYNATYLVLFNTIFTGGPVIVRALLEQDMNYLQIIQQIKDEKIQQQTQKPKIQLKQQLLHKNSPISKLSSIKTTPSLDNSQLDSKLPMGQSRDDRFFKSRTKIVSKLSLDQSLKSLFPMLYSHSQQQLSLTPRIFVLLILQSVIESFGIFLCIYYGIEAPQLWIFSICLYTIILALVTIRICYDITYWTWLIVFAILFTSVLPYIAFIYVMSLLQLQLTGTFIEIFKMPDFYLCLGFAVGLGSFIQASFNVISKYYFPTAIDLVRKQWKKIKKQQAQKWAEQRKTQRRINMESKYREILQSSRELPKPGAEVEMKQVRNWKNA